MIITYRSTYNHKLLLAYNIYILIVIVIVEVEVIISMIIIICTGVGSWLVSTVYLQCLATYLCFSSLKNCQLKISIPNLRITFTNSDSVNLFEMISKLQGSII